MTPIRPAFSASCKCLASEAIMLHRRIKVNRDRNRSPQPEKIAEKHRHNLNLLKTLDGRTKLAHKIVRQGADSPQVWRIYPCLSLQPQSTVLGLNPRQAKMPSSYFV